MTYWNIEHNSLKTYVRTDVRTYGRTVVQRRLYVSALRCRDKNTVAAYSTSETTEVVNLRNTNWMLLCCSRRRRCKHHFWIPSCLHGKWNHDMLYSMILVLLSLCYSLLLRVHVLACKIDIFWPTVYCLHPIELTYYGRVTQYSLQRSNTLLRERQTQSSLKIGSHWESEAAKAGVRKQLR